MRDVILNAMRQVAAETDCKLVSVIEDNSVLLETGIDSLGFAILVARLEEELGYDPFVMMEEPTYPRTFGEFVEIYQRFAQ
ncbi:MAG TPA: acyl carrier protein [Pirellulaceae bacterium]|nr:acyl carrier protein [Pirellulaceae bacterium]HMP70883.1 acyl carrier protein [Pirellulaceae bacterium]